MVTERGKAPKMRGPYKGFFEKECDEDEEYSRRNNDSKTKFEANRVD